MSVMGICRVIIHGGLRHLLININQQQQWEHKTKIIDIIIKRRKTLCVCFGVEGNFVSDVETR